MLVTAGILGNRVTGTLIGRPAPPPPPTGSYIAYHGPRCHRLGWPAKPTLLLLSFELSSKLVRGAKHSNTVEIRIYSPEGAGDNKEGGTQPKRRRHPSSITQFSEHPQYFVWPNRRLVPVAWRPVSDRTIFPARKLKAVAVRWGGLAGNVARCVICELVGQRTIGHFELTGASESLIREVRIFRWKIDGFCLAGNSLKWK
jgi:hypothetical protein